MGGTWYWNRYPGARCDIESMEYSYSFSEALQQQWHWSERFATQPEIQRYANHVAERFGLRPDMQFETRVKSAAFDEPTSRWAIATDKGEQFSARFLVMATGCLSSANLPDIEGRDSFAGKTLHTGQWPHEEVDLTGLRVGVISTGSSAVQSVPIIAAQAKELTIFQRTAAYSVPARNAPLDPEYEARIKADYAGFRARNSLMPNAFGSGVPRNEAPVLAASPEERNREFEADGFASQLASSAVILGASLVGGPVSTTQVASSVIMGVGAAERANKVRWGVAGEILLTWILTIPVSALIAAGIYYLLERWLG